MREEEYLEMVQHTLTRSQYREIRKVFAPVRKKVHEAIKAQPKQITLEEVKEQIKKFHEI